MSFRLVPNSVTLNDLERRNKPNSCLISPNSVAFWADCVKVVTLNGLERRNRPNGCLISPNSVAFWALLRNLPRKLPNSVKLSSC